MLGEWLQEQLVPAKEVVVEESEELGESLRLGSSAMFGSAAVAAFKLLVLRPLVCFCLKEGVCSPSGVHLVYELVLSLLELLLWLPGL